MPVILVVHKISDFGRKFLSRQLLKDLIRRLQIIDCLKRNPEIEDTPIPPILYITGHERSGDHLAAQFTVTNTGAPVSCPAGS